MEDNQDIEWTTAVPDKEALLNLLIFDAYLMKDNYSKEFFSDFADYYSGEAFEDSDFYFKSLAIDSEGENYGFNRLMDREAFALTRKYVQSSELPSAGLYRVEFAVYFGKDDWQFFETSGEPKAAIAIVVYKKDDAFPSSPFYSMPFDGMVGIKGNKYERKNYGTAYALQNPAGFVGISNEAPPVKTYEDNGSSPVTKADVKVETNLYILNTAPATRGMLLEVDKKTGKSAGITFQPAHATPVIMKASKSKLSSEKESVYYSVLESNTPVDVGNTLNYWDGAGSCLDFTGIPATEAFYQKPDRAAAADDEVLDWENLYATDWERIDKKGDVYLRTIMFTNPKSSYVLKTNSASGELEFLTADEQGQLVGLNGVSRMPYNNYAAGSIGAIDSIADVFEMVKNGQACVTNTGSSTKFWWNPQSVYTANGRERNVSEFVNSLEAGKTCIG